MCKHAVTLLLLSISLSLLKPQRSFQTLKPTFMMAFWARNNHSQQAGSGHRKYKKVNIVQYHSNLQLINNIYHTWVYIVHFMHLYEALWKCAKLASVGERCPNDMQQWLSGDVVTGIMQRLIGTVKKYTKRYHKFRLWADLKELILWLQTTTTSLYRNHILS